MQILRVSLIFTYAICCGCEKKIEQHSTQDLWLDFAESIVDAGRENDSKRLIELLSFNEKDLMELARNAEKHGLDYPPAKDVKRSLKESSAQLETEVRIFLKSYEDLFDGTVVRVVTAPKHMDVHELEVFEPCKAIIWVRKGERYFGIPVEEIFKMSTGLKTSVLIQWYPAFGGKRLLKEKAHHEASSIDSCNFPSAINYIREYPQ